ncbi:hypothetical protein R6138_04373 [Ralstonia thomasii]|uniref:hypothetical protein n=1 Tax=Ralstonia thomasii TaxID=3058596 RepID=UPI0028F5CFAD|nr:hypothetical protein [Ralstonia sp. LMG 18095]CAJ0899785.1 hypothetical protein R6138_04373 [Ralstonia sp. LMG 18095]
MSNTNANLPRPDSPIMLPDGHMSPEWWSFFLALFNRTGGHGSPIDINSLQKQDEISQDVQPQNAATMAALQGVSDLWAEALPPENLTDIRARLPALEEVTPTGLDVGPVLQRLNDLEAMQADYRLPVTPVLEQWNAPTLTNTWANLAGFNPAGYWKDPLGIVHLRGVIASGTINTAAFTLPAGYRPANTERFVAISNDAIGRLEVSSAGIVTPVIGSNVYFALDGMTFRASP